MTPRITQLTDEPTGAAPGELTTRGLRLEWDLDALTIVESGVRRVLGFATASLQLSRARLPVETTGWRRWLGLEPEPTGHLVVELRATRGDPLTLVAPATEADLDGLPLLQADGSRVLLGEMLALVQTARAGGARLARLPADIAPEPTELEVVERRVGVGYWLRVALAVALVAASLPQSLPWALVELDQWGGRRLVEGYAPLVAAVVPGPALAFLWWRHGRPWLWRAGAGRALAWAVPVALAPMLFFTVVMWLNACFDGTLRPGSGRLEYCAGLAMFHLGSVALALHTACWHRLRAGHGEVVVSGWAGAWRRQASRHDRTALADLLLAPQMRWLSDAVLIASLVREASPPVADVAPGVTPDPATAELVERLRPGLDGTWRLPSRQQGWRLVLAAVFAVACAAGLVMGAQDDARGLVFGVAMGVCAVWAMPPRCACLIDPTLGVVAQRWQRRGDPTEAALGEPVPGSWLEGGSAEHFVGMRAHAGPHEAILQLEARKGAPPHVHRLAGKTLVRLTDTRLAIAVADAINRDMARHGWSSTNA